MLINYLFVSYPNWMTCSPDIKDLNEFYKLAKKKFDEDEEFKKKS